MSYVRISHVYSLVLIDTLAWTLAAFVSCFYKWQVILWHDRANVIIFPDGKVFTCRILYINIVWYYWQKICRDGKFILSFTFLLLFILKTNKNKVYKNFQYHKARINYGTPIVKTKTSAVTKSNIYCHFLWIMLQTFFSVYVVICNLLSASVMIILNWLYCLIMFDLFCLVDFVTYNIMAIVVYWCLLFGIFIMKNKNFFRSFANI